MPENPDEKSGVPDRLKSWFRRAKSQGGSLLDRTRGRLQGLSGNLRKKVLKDPRRFEFDLKKVDVNQVNEYSHYIRWGLVVLALFLLAEIAARVIGLSIRTAYAPMPKRNVPAPQQTLTSGSEYDSITRRNMFNVEGKIPQPFDQGLLDCLSQAKPSSQRMLLLGTIVMNDDSHSVALVQEEGSTTKLAVKKDEAFFDGKFVAKKVERKKLCFQVRASSEFEFIEIPDDSLGMGMGAPALSGSDGITPVNDKEFVVKKSFLDEKLLNLYEILQTARAVPYTEPGTGKFMGFLVQSIEPGSPFAQLGVRQGDILTNVNDIVLDNAGKGLEAFQKLRNSPKVSLGIVRGGDKTKLSYDVK